MNIWIIKFRIMTNKNKTFIKFSFKLPSDFFGEMGYNIFTRNSCVNKVSEKYERVHLHRFEVVLCVG